MKKVSIKEILSLAILISPLAYLLINWAAIPQEISSRIEGPLSNDTGQLSKETFAMFYGLAVLVIYLLLLFGKRLVFKKESYDTIESKYGNLKILIAMAIALPTFYLFGIAENAFSEGSLANLVMFGVITVFCNYFPIMTERNYVMGIRTPWTLASDYVWNKTHQYIGKVWFVIGILAIILNFFLAKEDRPVLFWSFVIILLSHAMLYSLFIFIQEKRSLKNQ